MNDFIRLSRIWNTKESGVIEFLIYPEDNKYIGVCLSFDIIHEGNDIDKVQEELKNVARLHLNTVREKNFSDELLNRHAPQEYWDKYFEIQEAMEAIKGKRELDEKIVGGSETSKRIYRKEKLLQPA